MGERHISRIRVVNVRPFGDLSLYLHRKDEGAPGLIAVVGPPGSGKELLLRMVGAVLAGPWVRKLLPCPWTPWRFRYGAGEGRRDVIAEVTFKYGHTVTARWTPTRRRQHDLPLIQEKREGGTRSDVPTADEDHQPSWPLQLRFSGAWDPSRRLAISEWFRDSNAPGHIELLDVKELVVKRFPSASCLSNLDDLATNAEEIVLLGYPEAELHPTQRRGLGGWLKEKFPEAQFIISTNDPLMCQDADCIVKLSGIDDERKVKGGKAQVLLPGDPVYHQVTGGTPNDALFSIFDLPSVYSPRTDRLLDKLASLESRVIDGEASEEEQEEVRKLDKLLPPSAEITRIVRSLRDSRETREKQEEENVEEN